MKAIIVADEKSLDKYKETNKTLIEMSYEMFGRFFDKNDIQIQTLISLKDNLEKLLPDANIFYEPEKKGTAPAIGLALVRLYIQNPGEDILIAYSDHPVRSEENLFSVIKNAGKIANSLNNIVLIGVNPSFPATNYGYAQIGKVKEQIGDTIAFEMSSFEEKPTLEKANQYIESWKYLWNTGYLIASVERLLEVYKELQPNLYKGLMTIKEAANTDFEKSVTTSVYDTFSKLSIDKGIYELIDKNKVVVLPVDLDIKDLQI